MSHFDVFNGDADGICALQQLRLAQPREATAVSGLKRDIELLERVDAGAGDRVTVLDISLARNRAALMRLLERGAEVEYFDHHHPGDERLPAHPRLRLHIDTAPQVCTSVLVDRYLGGSQRAWAVVGAYGDNLGATAEALAEQAGLVGPARRLLRELGEAINYNAYGDTLSDPLLPPPRLYEALRPYRDPLAFIAEQPLAQALVARMGEDLGMATRELRALRAFTGGSVYLMPDQAWARRVQGVLAHALARDAPDRAHAIVRQGESDAFVVSVRAPLNAPRGADILCRCFEGGGGRAGAAGIDHLPRELLPTFLEAFDKAFGSPG